MIAEASQKQIHVAEYDQELIRVRSQILQDERVVNDLKGKVQNVGCVGITFQCVHCLAHEWNPCKIPLQKYEARESVSFIKRGFNSGYSSSGGA